MTTDMDTHARACVCTCKNVRAFCACCAAVWAYLQRLFATRAEEKIYTYVRTYVRTYVSRHGNCPSCESQTTKEKVCRIGLVGGTTLGTLLWQSHRKWRLTRISLVHGRALAEMQQAAPVPVLHCPHIGHCWGMRPMHYGVAPKLLQQGDVRTYVPDCQVQRHGPADIVEERGGRGARN